MGQEGPSTKEELLSSTPYDDVHRTMENDCRKWLIPLVSEIFQENLDEYNDVVFTKEIHYMNHEGGGEEKRITDGSFRLIARDEETKEKISVKEKEYLCECQTNADSSILIRMFEYATQTALDEGILEDHVLKVTIPHCAVIFLRPPGTDIDSMTMRIEAPNGTLDVDVRVVRVSDYSLDEIFEKKLYILLPFYLFRYEKQFPEYNTNDKMLESLKAEYVTIGQRLDELVQQGVIEEYSKKITQEMSVKVLVNLAVKYDRLRDEVREVMGGKVIMTEATRILNQGKAEGKAEGRTENLLENLRALMETMALTAEQALAALKVPEDQHSKYLSMLK